MTIFDVDQLPTHGGSLRVYARHAEDETSRSPGRSRPCAARSLDDGVNRLDYYRSFGQQVISTKHRLPEFLIAAKAEGRSIAGYGAPGKGNTLLNYCGIRTTSSTTRSTCNPYKQGRYLPGTHIPILHPDRLGETRPDYVLILPWNLADEIMRQLAFVREWGGCRRADPQGPSRLVMLGLTSAGWARRWPPGPALRRPRRRHRDRLRRHRPDLVGRGPGRGRDPSCSAGRRNGPPRPRRARRRSSTAWPTGRSACTGSGTGSCPMTGPRSRTSSSGSSTRSTPTSCSPTAAATPTRTIAWCRS